MSKRIHILLLLLFISLLGYAQVEECGTVFYNESTEKSTIELSPLIKSARMKMAQGLNTTNTVYKIPIVVHVFKDDGRNSSLANITEQSIKDWLVYTNKLYKGELNSKSSLMSIEFVLATVDENCNPSTGIVWVDAHRLLPNYSQYGVSNGRKTEYPNAYITSELRPVSYWNPKKYINIFVVNDANGVAGFAHYPDADNPTNVVIASQFRAGVGTGPHELGHSLGLLHTFEGDGGGTTCPTNTDCLNQGDKVCDTNPHINFRNCPSATTQNCDKVAYASMAFDLRNNIMSYSTCSRDLLTLGQRQRAREQYLIYKPSVINTRATEIYLSGNTPPKPSVKGCSTTSESTSASYGAGVIYFKLGTIDNTSKALTGAANDFLGGVLVDYSSDNVKCIEKDDYVTYLNRNQEQSVTIGVKNNTQTVKVYIDYNYDGVFDENTERVVSSRQSPGETTYKFTPRSTAPLNRPLRLRVVADRSSSIEATNSCKLVNGQAEDYTIIFTEGTSGQAEVTVEVIKEEK